MYKNVPSVLQQCDNNILRGLWSSCTLQWSASRTTGYNTENQGRGRKSIASRAPKISVKKIKAYKT